MVTLMPLPAALALAPVADLNGLCLSPTETTPAAALSCDGSSLDSSGSELDVQQQHAAAHEQHAAEQQQQQQSAALAASCGDALLPPEQRTHHLLKHCLSQSQRSAALQHFNTADAREAAKEIARMGQRELQAKFKVGGGPGTRRFRAGAEAARAGGGGTPPRLAAPMYPPAPLPGRPARLPLPQEVYGSATKSNNNSWLRRKLYEAVGVAPLKANTKGKARKSAAASHRKSGGGKSRCTGRGAGLVGPAGRRAACGGLAGRRGGGAQIACARRRYAPSAPSHTVAYPAPSHTPSLIPPPARSSLPPPSSPCRSLKLAVVKVKHEPVLQLGLGLPHGTPALPGGMSILDLHHSSGLLSADTSDSEDGSASHGYPASLHHRWAGGGWVGGGGGAAVGGLVSLAACMSVPHPPAQPSRSQTLCPFPTPLLLPPSCSAPGTPRSSNLGLPFNVAACFGASMHQAPPPPPPGFVPVAEPSSPMACGMHWADGGFASVQQPPGAFLVGGSTPAMPTLDSEGLAAAAGLPASTFKPMDLEQDAAALWAGGDCPSQWYFGSMELGAAAAPGGQLPPMEGLAMDCCGSAATAACACVCEEEEEVPLLTLDLGGAWEGGREGCQQAAVAGRRRVSGAAARRQAGSMPAPRSPLCTPPACSRSPHAWFSSLPQPSTSPFDAATPCRCRRPRAVPPFDVGRALCALSLRPIVPLHHPHHPSSPLATPPTSSPHCCPPHLCRPPPATTTPIPHLIGCPPR